MKWHKIESYKYTLQIEHLTVAHLEMLDKHRRHWELRYFGHVANFEDLYKYNVLYYSQKIVGEYLISLGTELSMGNIPIRDMRDDRSSIFAKFYGAIN